MMLFELMEWLEMEYVSGCQAFYAKQNPDRWHLAFEDMIAEFHATPGFEAQSAVVAKHAKTFGKLLAAYVKSGPKIELTRPWEAFYGKNFGLEGLSVTERCCVKCGETKPPLRISVIKNSGLPVLKCGTCP